MSECTICHEEISIDLSDYTLDENTIAQVTITACLVSEVHRLRHAIEAIKHV